ncbi:MAG: DUF1573 domain-containing protein, partial [Candidatus Cryptobacteroides sp.]|nr:DUF1573 domain-containing protein [Candidatus Cryptobacteroides sp.]
MKMLFLSILAALALVQDGNIKWDKTLHDFGDVSVTDGPLTCTYTLTNTGQEPIAIFEVVTSCGCTNVVWTKEPIQPGKTGTVSATYKNEDGPMPFDKTLTVYISGIKRPVILRLRGVVHEKKKTLSELYGAQKLGAFGIKSRQLKTGNLKQAQKISEQVSVANLGKKPLKVTWANVSEELSLNVEPNPIPAGSTAKLTYTVRANPSKYGRWQYTATPVLNGQKAEGALEITTWTQENFAVLDQATRDKGPIPYFTGSTVNLGTASKGANLTAEFTCTNRGKSALHFYKADAESQALTLSGALADIAAGKKGSVRFTLDTSLLETGENVIMVSLT